MKRLLLPFILAAARFCQADPLISEFLASNVTGKQDEDGQRGDWIEIHSPDGTPVNLAGWHLTDKATNLNKWTFPAVTIPAKGFLLVWATEKNRTNPAGELHTNFKLDAGGEYLALTRPDSSVAHAFAPTFPPQAADVAYGVPVTKAETVVTTAGAPAKVLVPSSGALGTTWTAPAFNDSAWAAAKTGVGYDAPVPPVEGYAQYADSVTEFSGTQGQNGWSYGYWNKTLDADQLYQPGDVTLFTGAQFTGGFWDLNTTGAPWTEINSGGGHPNGTNSGDEHWTVRRWVSEFTGRARFVGNLSDGAECGDGVGLRIYIEGTLVYNKSTLSAIPVEFAVEADVQSGQRVDFVITPLANDGCDGHAFNVKVYSGTLADSVADWSASGTQSSRRWTYGYYRRSSDGDGVYQTSDFVSFPRTTGNVVSATNAWNGTNWQLTTTTPVTALTATGGTPSVTTNQDWPVRRWTCNYTGRLRITGSVGHINAGSDGIVARIWLNGAQIFAKTVNNTNEGYSVIADVTNGSLLDFSIAPNTTETADANSIFTAVISAATIGSSVAADSIADYGTGAQGTNGWSHGYYNKTDDANGVYNAADLITSNANWTLSGNTWVLGPGDPPWTSVHARGGHPNGTNQAAPNNEEHWAVHRWTSTVTGPLTIDWNLAKAGAGGNGTTVKVFVNGVERDSASVAGTDRVGFTRSTVLNTVAVGDSIDIALTPVGPAGATDDGSDGSLFSARILNNTLPPNITLTPQADSVSDWSASGTQGYRGWSYGYYNKTTDGDGIYQTANFSAFLNDGSNVISGTNQWNGGGWDLNPAASGPWTELGQTTCHPNGTNSTPGHEHWCIRRWTSTVSGALSVSYKVWKGNPSGGGVTIRAFHNGTLKDTVAIAGTDTTGVTRSFVIPAAAIGDSIDVALTPVGLAGGTDDGSDGSAFTVAISRLTQFSDNIDASAGNIQPLMYGVNASAYLRVPVTGPATTFDSLKLRMKFDDGFVAFLNGTEVARRSVPVAAAGGFFADSVAEFSGVQGQSNWFYGYWKQADDANGTYEREEFTTNDPTWGYAPSVWAFRPGNPPWTSLDAGGGHPNGSNSTGGIQHNIRRWVAETSGTVTARVRVYKTNPFGTGITGHLKLNGRTVWSQVVAGNDSVGYTADVSVADVQINDSLDLVMDATGVGGDTTDGADGSYLAMTVEQQPSAGLSWNSAATGARAMTLAGTFEEFDITPNRFLLTPGSNLLAFHGLNASAADPDFLLLPELVGTVITADPNGRVYFTIPTPGLVNGTGAQNIGPLVTDVTDSPVVADADNIVVTARVRPTLEAVNTVTLTYRVMYGPEASLTMRDDGLSGDGPAGDGYFGATIPASASAPGEMVRWRIAATDLSGDLTRSPSYTNPANSPEYWGTVVTVANVVPGGQLPVLHWFTNNAAAHDGTGGGRCAIFFNGQFLDNVAADLHGQSSTGFPKKSYDFDLNTGFKLEWDTTPMNTSPKVNSFNLLTTYPDKANLRNLLTYATFEAAGVPGHWARPVQVLRNNAFYSVAHMVEDGDTDYLQRAPGLDDQGALYKMYNTFYDPAGGEKKSRKWESNADLAAFMAGLGSTGVTRERFLYDNAGVPETINYLTAQIMTGNDDCCHKNYYVYRDSEGNREWRPLPWDVDLSYGRVWRPAETYYRDTMTWDTSLFVGQGNQLMTPFSDGSHADFRAMYLRRLRTLADTILNQSAVPVANRWVENQLNIFQPLVQPEADYERLSGLWSTWGTPQTMAQAVDIIRNDYLPQRRAYMFSQAVLPPSQDPLITVNFGTVVFDPASHNQAEEYFTLVNPSATVAVDVSNWVISGAVNHTLKPGTVIPAGGTLYLSPDVNAFRARTTSPKGNEGRFIQGNYNGQLSARGETLTLMDGMRLVATMTYTGTPSAAQTYLRVTEMMYSPGAKPGDTFVSDEYEFIELKNISASTPVPLTGVQFSNGIAFTFTSGSLAPGALAVLVRNAAAFAQRYPSVTIAGTYTGSLDNGGERVVLLDANNEEVLDFSYEDDWYPATDGAGFSLVAANELQSPDLWTLKIGWKPSGTVCGTPGSADRISDTDQDGLSDYDEWLAGTDPLQPQSVFSITAGGFTGGIYSGTFEGLAGKTYTVQYSDSLTPGSWLKLTDFAPAADGIIVFTDTPPLAAVHRFYRTITPAMP